MKPAITCFLAFVSLLSAPAGAATGPKFKLDPNWPQQMPNGYFFGQIAGLTVDSHGNVWVLSRPRSIVPQLDEPPQPVSGVPAPSVVEFDAQGKFIRAWGGPFAMSDAERAQFDWPVQEHGIAVDAKDNVWICGNGRDAKNGKDDNQCLKFTTDGKFVMQVGKSAQSKGSLDTANMNHPAQPVYYAPANELVVADGYVNRRVIVLDADSGKFKRMWGAYGKAPDDSVPRDRAYDPPPQQFNLVHGLVIANDGIVYVADRNNNRVQAFTLDGKFLKEGVVARCQAIRISASSISAKVISSASVCSTGRHWRKFRKPRSAMSASIPACSWGCTSSPPMPRAISIPAMAATAGCRNSILPVWIADRFESSCSGVTSPG
jgi:hypothetical protein